MCILCGSAKPLSAWTGGTLQHLDESVPVTYAWPVTGPAPPDTAPPGSPTSFEQQVAYISGINPDGTINNTSYWGFTSTTAHKFGSTTAGSGASISYTFDAASNFTVTEQNTLVTAMEAWSAIADVKFTLGGNNANVKFQRGGAGSGANESAANTSGSGSTLGQNTGQQIINIETSRAGWDLSGSLDIFGGFGMQTAIHEVGHLLGLGHGGNYNGAVNPATQQFGQYDLRLWSLMSYIGWNQAGTGAFAGSYDYLGVNWGNDPEDGGFRQTHTVMPIDIIAIQRLYGASKNTQFAGNDVFGFNTTITGNLQRFYDFTSNTTPVVTVYSQGKNNTLDLSGFAAASTVSLVPGTFTSAAGLTYNIGIAFGTTVETAITGAGNDTIIGNDDNNVLDGGAGIDTLNGGAGWDTVSYRRSSAGVDVDLGRVDTHPPTGGDAQGDVLISIENLIGSAFDDRLVGVTTTIEGVATGSVIDGLSGNDTMFGGEAKDTLSGGKGDDTIVGNGGNDLLYGGMQNLVINGGFETTPGVVVKSDGYTDLVNTNDGWGLLSGPGLELFTSGVVGAAPFEGKYGVDLTGVAAGTNVSITQQLTAAEKDATYRIAFEARKVDNASNARLEVYWGGQKLSWFETSQTYIDPTTSYVTYYVDVTGGFGTGPDKNRLTFAEIGAGTANGTLLDNVRVYKVQPGTPKADDQDPSNDGNDIIDAGVGADIAYGNGGNDRIIFADVNKLNDSADGGSGIDTLVMNWSNAKTSILHFGLGAHGAPIGNSEHYRRQSNLSDTGQYLYFKEFERFELTGGSAGDTLRGGLLDDILIGNNGDDTLIGGGGIDMLNGGSGFDRAVISLSGSTANTIRLRDAVGSGSIVLSNGTTLTSIESIGIESGDGDDFLDVRGVVTLPAGRTSTTFDGKGGNDTLAVDAYTSYGATFIGGAGDGDLLIMDWSAVTAEGISWGEGMYRSVFERGSVNGVPYELAYTVTYSGVERFDLTGGSKSDDLRGGAGNDSFKTFAGHDTITAGAGFDVLVIDWSAVTDNWFRTATFTGSLEAGYDGYINNEFNDGGGRSRVSFTGVERFDITLGADDDHVSTGDAADRVVGNAGNDIFWTGKGADIVDGGEGTSDRWQADKSDATLGMTIRLASAVSNYVVGGLGGSMRNIEALGWDDGAYRFQTGSGNDIVVTLAAYQHDYIQTNGGDDTVTIYAGADIIRMDAGFDTLIIDWSAVTDNWFRTATFTGTLETGYDGYINNEFNDGSGRSRVSFSGVERFDITLGADDDQISTGDAADRLIGNAGNDTFWTGKGADVVDGGDGADRWQADKSDATLGMTIRLAVVSDYTVGGVTGSVRNIEALGWDDGAYRFQTGSGNDTVVTLTAYQHDYIQTNGGDDKVTIYAGADVVRMDAGFDTLIIDWSAVSDNWFRTAEFGGSLADGYDGYINNEFNDGGGRSRVRFSGVERFDITLGGDDDLIHTGDADDRVIGNAGSDYFLTRKGSDVVDGGDGADRWQANKSDATANITINLAVASTYKVGSVTGSVQNIEALGSSDGSANDRFQTGLGSDTIVTLAGYQHDYIQTNAGNDTVTIFAGADVVRMDAGFDTLVIDWSAVTDNWFRAVTFEGTLSDGYEGYINNEFNDGAGRSRVTFSGIERFDITLGGDADIIVTGDANDRLIGNGGNDGLVTRKGADVVDGGAGDDRWQGDKSNATANMTIDLAVLSTYTVGGVAATVQNIEALGWSDAVGERFQSGSGNDTISTRAAYHHDYIQTNAGNDTVKLFAGADIVRMDAGFDTLVIDWSAVTDNWFRAATFTGSLALGYDGYINNEFNDGSNRSRVSFTGVERFDITLGGDDDYVVTGDADDRVIGNAGNDLLRTGQGADVVDGGAGTADRWLADKSPATTGMTIALGSGLSNYAVGAVAGSVQNIEALGVSDGAASERFQTGSGNDTVVTLGLYHHDYIQTNAGDDTVKILAGADVVRMDAGFDTLIIDWSAGTDYAFGSDPLTGTLAAGYSGYINNQFNDGGGRNRVVFSGVERFDVTLGAGNDFLITGDGNDRVVSGVGNDTLRTGKGADVIDGGAGVDRWQADKSNATDGMAINLRASASTYVVGGVVGSVKGIEALGVGGAVGERFATGAGSDTVTTRTEFLSDFVETNGGNDTVTLFAGADFAAMGLGTDTLVIDWTSILDYRFFTSDFSGTLATGYSGFINNQHNDGGRNRAWFEGVEHFNIALGSGGDDITTGDGNDTLDGREGDDVLRTGKGADQINGGLGNDRWMADKSNAIPGMVLNLNNVSSYVVGGITATVRNIEALGLGDSDGNRFVASTRSDAIVTRSAYFHDYIDTGAGNDTVTVAGGADAVVMGAGTDLLIVDWSAVTDYSFHIASFTGSLAAGYDGFINNQFNDGGGRNRVSYSGVERFDITLGAASDNVRTGDGVDTVDGGAGNDMLWTGMGADIVEGGAGNDRWQADKSNATAAITIDLARKSSYAVDGKNGTVKGIEALGGSNANGDRFSTGAGADTIVTLAAGFGDYIETNAGNDTVTVAGGEDVVLMGAGSDMLVVNWSGITDYNMFTASLTGTLAAGYDGFINNQHNDGGRTRLGFSGVERFDMTLGGGHDSITTGDGDDRLMGGGGNDTLAAGDGHDYLKGGDGTDTLAGGAGIDTADFSDKTVAISVTLALSANATVFVGGVAEDTLSNIENLIGGSGGDTLTGDSAANVLAGGAGNDILTGGAGRDMFDFTAKLSKNTNVDTIVDFNVADDTIVLDNAVFAKLVDTGVLAGGFFCTGPVAQDANDFIVYNSLTGGLFYDKNGSGNGEATQFATVASGLALTANNFLVA